MLYESQAHLIPQPLYDLLEEARKYPDAVIHLRQEHTAYREFRSDALPGEVAPVEVVETRQWQVWVVDRPSGEAIYRNEGNLAVGLAHSVREFLVQTGYWPAPSGEADRP